MAPAPADPTAAYVAFLRSRWPTRSRALAQYALGGSLSFALFDWLLTRAQPGPPSVAAIAGARLAWIAAPAFGLWVVRRWPGWRGLPALVIALSLIWSWGNEWAFFRLGQAGTVMQAVAVVAACVTAANFLPLRLGGVAAVLAAIGLGHVALDVWWPQDRPLALRLWTDAAVLAMVVVQIAVFRNLVTSQLRGTALRARLEGAMAELASSQAAREQELQARVQQALHEVKVLSGLLPICAWCKSVRADSGYWEQIEAYLGEHSQASFTHSICPRCADQNFGAGGEEPGEA